MTTLSPSRRTISSVSCSLDKPITRSSLTPSPPGWLDVELSRLKNPTKIVVQTIGPDGQPRDVPLTAEVWQHSLLRGPWRDAFAGIWDRHIRAQCLREEALADLSTTQPGFRQSCRDFVCDLRAFGSDEAARSRLEQTVHEFYMGRPYFSDDTRDRLLAVPTASHGGTLESALRALAEKRRDGTICASHDLSPMFEAALGIVWDKDSKKDAVEQLQSAGGLSMKARMAVQRGGRLLRGALSLGRGQKGGLRR